MRFAAAEQACEQSLEPFIDEGKGVLQTVRALLCSVAKCLGAI